MPYFESPVDGARLHHIDHGPRSGPVAVFVSSAYLGHEMWEYQTLPLAEAGFRCVALDRRGHGRSEDTWSGFDLDTLADDLHGLLDHLDLTAVTLIGHSVGALEVVRCLTRHGHDRVARVALVSGIAPGVLRTADNPDGLEPAAFRADNQVFRRDRAAYYAAGLDAFFAVGRPGVDVSPAYAQYLMGQALVATARGTNGIRDVIATTHVEDELPKLTLPALVLHGPHDTSAPLERTGARAARLLPDSTLKVYENGGHGMFATHADRLTADLRAFMTAG